jgi:xanthine/CO dehydrogenase XdhC/CoxF family maturation factor
MTWLRWTHSAPAFFYIGSRTPPEIALSILVEIVAAKNGVALLRAPRRG